ncbi:MAG: Lrp/AsnC family transcriptional regulator [Alphaproteobacteria bacterium]|nr:Lrp/AsnC family transcriptional regulator [Alphaproteobacteria bacterium SS10]
MKADDRSAAGLDKIDQKILAELSNDGRISNAELANRVSLSPSACLRRVQALEESGIILGYRAVLDRTKLGGDFLAYVAVRLSSHNKDSQANFEQQMADEPAVLECHNVTGTIEYLLRVEVSDLKAYKQFHTEVLGTVQGVAGITSYIVMGSPIDKRG